jgi:hypothetical protein
MPITLLGLLMKLLIEDKRLMSEVFQLRTTMPVTASTQFTKAQKSPVPSISNTA